MRIVSITPKPEAQCIEPTLLLDLTIAFQRGQRMPLNLTVQVHTEDKKLLGIAQPTTMGQERLGLDAYDSAYSGHNNEVSVTAQAVLGLSPKQVDYLEGLRAKHSKGDVVLQCQVEAQFLVSKTALAYLQRGERLADTDQQLVVYKNYGSRDPFYSNISNMWVLSGNGGLTFIEREILRHAATVTIKSSDWLHDYSSPWRNTRYMVVELPQAEVLTSAPSIEERVNAAIEAAKKAADSIAKGEWNDALEDLRPVWELLRKQANIKDLLQRDGYTQEAIDAFEAIVQQQFTLASKFIHREDKSGKRINPEIQASKEDAMVCYSCAMSLLNLVSRKAARLR